MTVNKLLESLALSGYTDEEINIVRRTTDGMKDLSLLILDIVRNSIEASARNISVSIDEDSNSVSFIIEDDGNGIPEDLLYRAVSVGYTTKKPHSLGLGLPLFSAMAEQTGGSFAIKSDTGVRHGTRVSAVFSKNSELCPEIGDMPSTVSSIVSGLDGINLEFVHTLPCGMAAFNTKALAASLNGIPFSSPFVLKWVREYLEEQYKIIS